MFLLLASILFVYMCIGFFYALYIKNNAIADVIYAKAIMVLVLVSYVLGASEGMAFLLTVLTVIWGVRLSARIYFKNLGKPEDARYAQWRSEWSKRSQKYFVVRSFLQIFMLQGLVIATVATPVVLVNLYGLEAYPCAYFGVGLWCVGFFFEAVADFQLDRYIRKPENKGTLCTIGLWSYSRHPNYFGESLMWWGIALSAASVLPSEILAALSFVSPVLITFLLLRVSGVPMLEALMKDKPGWSEYAARTNAFFPWFPRRDV